MHLSCVNFLRSCEIILFRLSSLKSFPHISSSSCLRVTTCFYWSIAFVEPEILSEIVFQSFYPDKSKDVWSCLPDKYRSSTSLSSVFRAVAIVFESGISIP